MAEKINMMMNSFIEETKISPRPTSGSVSKPASRPMSRSSSISASESAPITAPTKKVVAPVQHEELDDEFESLLRAVTTESPKKTSPLKSKPKSALNLSDENTDSQLSDLLDEIASTSPAQSMSFIPPQKRTPVATPAATTPTTKLTPVATPSATPSTTPSTTPGTVRRKCEVLYIGGSSSQKGVNVTLGDRK